MNFRFTAPRFPSFTLGASMDSVGAPSSSRIVPVTLAVAFVGPLSVTTTVSSASSSASPVTATSTVRLVVPAANVSVPSAMAV